MKKIPSPFFNYFLAPVWGVVYYSHMNPYYTFAAIVAIILVVTTFISYRRKETRRRRADAVSLWNGGVCQHTGKTWTYGHYDPSLGYGFFSNDIWFYLIYADILGFDPEIFVPVQYQEGYEVPITDNDYTETISEIEDRLHLEDETGTGVIDVDPVPTFAPAEPVHVGQVDREPVYSAPEPSYSSSSYDSGSSGGGYDSGGDSGGD